MVVVLKRVVQLCLVGGQIYLELDREQVCGREVDLRLVWVVAYVMVKVSLLRMILGWKGVCYVIDLVGFFICMLILILPSLRRGDQNEGLRVKNGGGRGFLLGRRNWLQSVVLCWITLFCKFLVQIFGFGNQILYKVTR